LKKQYETPVVYIEEYEIENTLGNLCSGADDIPYEWPGDLE
jgi:hypothetical protein